MTSKAFSANESVQRYFIWKYIKAREGYVHSIFNYNYKNVVRVLSSSEVYGQYRNIARSSNPKSLYNTHAKHSTRDVYLKSMVFTSSNTVQVRVSFEDKGSSFRTYDKIILLEFAFENVEMNNDERFINPLGFMVTLYKIEDEVV